MPIFFILLIFILIGVLAYLFFWPVSVNVKPIELAPYPKAEGVLAHNDLLSNAEPFGPELPGNGPEDITFDAEGNLYSGLDNGKIIKTKKDGSAHEVYADVGGRPLGLDFDKEGNLYVANAFLGLQVVTKSREIKTLLTQVGDKSATWVEDVAVADDGLIYFNVGSYKTTFDKIFYGMLDAAGILAAYNSKTGETKELFSPIRFANGVGLNKEQTYVLVNETATGKILIHWIKGPEAGRTNVLIPRMPGDPDNISSEQNGVFWVALFTDGKLGEVFARSPFLQQMLLKIPASISFNKHLDPKTSAVAAVDGKGNIVKYLKDGKHALPAVSSVIEREGWLYIGSLFGKYIYRLKI